MIHFLSVWLGVIMNWDIHLEHIHGILCEIGTEPVPEKSMDGDVLLRRREHLQMMANVSAASSGAGELRSGAHRATSGLRRGAARPQLAELRCDPSSGAARPQLAKLRRVGESDEQQPWRVRAWGSSMSSVHGAYERGGVRQVAATIAWGRR